ncbi:S1C family serine protease [Desulfitobacterium sp.]|uniref:S1C family serine protease n=1 Tax=Desulfitobacterium sp. TaxID=49981 RepID=UPI002D0A150E|nr:trypsin-like peptidase domain-containing protein [Desulfitobacterium sp.]HVJ49857.1 trypsin-like peptidase domain-containing protein [Desulfitobacterium sp.]
MNNDDFNSKEHESNTPPVIEAIILDSKTDPNSSTSSQFSSSPHSTSKPKRTIAAIATLCLASAFIGGLTTATALPHIYPNLFTVQTTSTPTSATTTPTLPATTLSTNTSQFPVAEIAKNVGPAVVGVSNFQSSPQSNSGYFRSSSNNNSSSGLQEAGSGSGFIIDAAKGYIVTNNHVIDGAQKITVSLSDGRTLDAKLVGADSRTDLAVLQISDAQNLTAVTLGDSSNLEVGASVVAIGNPGGNDFARSVTTGVISATNRTLDLQGESSFGLIQTDAAINPGNSGGPLVDYQGKVIGINSAKYAQTGFEGMGFSIPISDALPTIQQLIQTGKATHPALYVSVNDQYNAYAQSNNLTQGAYVADVTAGGPAAKAGITKDDVITKINDTAVKSSGDLVRELYKYKIGDQISVTFVRNGNTQVVQATLGEITSK